jgi:hypothetical protein
MSSVHVPESSEYHEYYQSYVSKVPEVDIVEVLKTEHAASVALLGGLPDALHEHRYAPGKWSVKEVIGHLVDTEWIFTYRALRFARGDTTPLPGVDQDVLIAGANFGSRSMANLVAEWKSLRAANTVLFASFGEEVLDRRGSASDCEFTVRALPYIIAGHERHHMGVLRDRYFA